MRTQKRYWLHMRHTFGIALPICLGQASIMLGGFADNVMVGKVGATELAACGFANSVWVLFLILGIGLTFGITPLIGNAYAAKDHKACASLLYNNLLMCGLSGLLLTILCCSFTPMLAYFGQEQEVLDLSYAYYLIIGASIFPYMIFISFKQYLDGMGKTKVGLYCILGCNLVNVLLNYFLIYGYWGFPKLGLEGAGWATLISRVLMPICVVWYFVKSKELREIRKELMRSVLDKGTLSHLMRYGIPSALQAFLEVAAFVFGAIIIGWVSKYELAAHQAAINLASFTYLIASGIGTATTISISSRMGKKQYRNAVLSGKIGIFLAFVFMFVNGLVFFFANEFLPYIYLEATEQQVLAITAQLFIIGAFFQIADGVQVVSIGALRGIADPTFPTIVSILAYWVVALPLGYYWAYELKYGAVGMWYAYLTGLTIAAVFLSIRYWLKSAHVGPNTVISSSVSMH